MDRTRRLPIKIVVITEWPCDEIDPCENDDRQSGIKSKIQHGLAVGSWIKTARLVRVEQDWLYVCEVSAWWGLGRTTLQVLMSELAKTFHTFMQEILECVDAFL